MVNKVDSSINSGKQENNNPNNNSISSNSLEDKLADIAIATIKEIVQDNENRAQNFKTEGSLLGSGVYFPTQYYSLLKDYSLLKAKDRIAFMRDKGSFFHGYTSSNYFSHEKSSIIETGYEMSGFNILPNVKASLALKKIKEGISLLNGFDVCTIANYTAIKEHWGEEKFDALCDYNSYAPLRFGLNTSLQHFMKIRNHKMDLKKGEWVMLNGPKVKEIACFEFSQMTNLYGYKNPYGDAPLLTVLCRDNQEKDKQKLVGLGLKAEGETHEESCQTYLDIYNADPVNGIDIVKEEIVNKVKEKMTESESLLTYSLKSHKFKNVKEFKTANGGSLFFKAWSLNVELIDQIAKATIQEAKEIMKRKCAESTFLMFIANFDNSQSDELN